MEEKKTAVKTEVKKPKIENPFLGRSDGLVYKASDYSDGTQKTWIHKKVVKRTGDGEDDFILEEKPVCIETIDLDKEIQERAKGCDLKSLIRQCLREGNDPNTEFAYRDEQALDITGFPTDIIEAHNSILRGQSAWDHLDKELKEKGLEGLLSMTPDQLLEYVQKKTKSSGDSSDKKVEKVEKVIEEKEGDKHE